MHLASLRNLRWLFGPATLLILACGPGTSTQDAGAGTGGTSQDDGSVGDDTSADSTSAEGSSADSSSADSSSADSSSADGPDNSTGTTDPACGVVQLVDVAQGIGGFAIDGELMYDESGSSASGAGDVNGDGLADVIIGMPCAWTGPYAYSCQTYVVFGKAETDSVALSDVADGIGGFPIDGERDKDAAGSAVSGAGDVNGDGLADVIVAAPAAELNGLWAVGRTYVVFGRVETDRVRLWNVADGGGGFAMDGEAERDFSGQSVSGAGDVNGDGLVDFVVEAPDASVNGFRTGRTYVVFGKPDTEPVALAHVATGVGGFAVERDGEDDGPESRVSEAGDVNGDGLADVIVGASGADAAGVADSGRTYVVFGKADTDKVQLGDIVGGIGGFAMDGEAELDGSGWSVSGAGDVNGDGLADIIVGAPGVDTYGASASGRTYVVFGGDFSCAGR